MSSHSETIHPMGPSDDGLYGYWLIQAGPEQPEEPCSSEQWSVIVTSYSNPAQSHLVRGFKTRAQARAWIRIHARDCDLRGFNMLRLSRAVHQWASQRNNRSLGVLDAARLLDQPALDLAAVVV